MLSNTRPAGCSVSTSSAASDPIYCYCAAGRAVQALVQKFVRTRALWRGSFGEDFRHMVAGFVLVCRLSETCWREGIEQVHGRSIS